jgi:hypothetical protein
MAKKRPNPLPLFPITFINAADMKKIIPLLSLPLLNPAGLLHADTTESSGTQTISIASGTSARYELLSISLFSESLYAGTVVSVNTNTVTLDSADFSNADLTTYPYFLRVKASGSNQGSVYLITAHTSTGTDDSVTVDTTPSLSANDEVTVIPAHTLASLFGIQPESCSSIVDSSGTVTVTTAAAHGLNTGDSVTIEGATGDSGVNDTHTITRTSSTTFTLDDYTGTGTYSGGTWYNGNWPTIGNNTTAGDSTDNDELLVGSPAVADNVIVWNTTSSGNSIGWKTYFHHTTGKWYTAGTRANQEFTVIYPDEGLVLVRNDTDSFALTLSGVVPAINAMGYHPSAGNKFLLSNPYPVAIGLADLALDAASSKWTQSDTASSADQVLVWTGSTWSTFYKKTNGDWANASDAINYSNQATATAVAGTGGSNALQTADLTLTSGGSGYSFANTNFSVTPSVAISGGGGSGATAEVTLSGDSVASIAITNGGSGYTSAPTITITYPIIPSGGAAMIVRQSGGSGGNEFLQATVPY